MLHTVSLIVTSSLRVHSCASSIPLFPISVASHDDRQHSHGCLGSRLSSCVIKNTSCWFQDQLCWWNLVWQLSTEHLCSEAGDSLVRAEESVETARSTVNHLVLSKTKETTRSFEEDCSLRDNPNKKQRFAGGNQQKSKRRQLKNLCK